MNTKIIVLTGGVYSSLGKGITSGSIGRIIKELGYSVSIIKFDPYLNINPAQISPLQHGELFITNDGCETDLDIGHYERFIGVDLNKYSSVCSGKIYKEIIDNQLNNKYGGSTIQVVPHLTDLIIQKIKDNINNNKTDFLIIEIGGTVGDIESIPFYEAIKRYLYQYGHDSILFVHCIPVLTLSSVHGEIKTKPAQHSIEKLRSFGWNPDILIIRSEEKIEENLIEKISKLVLIKKESIFNSYNINCTYKLINILFDQKIYLPILNHFNLKCNNININNWELFSNSINTSENSNKVINAMIIGEYTSLHDAYFSVYESLRLASYKYGFKVNINWLSTSDINQDNIKILDQIDLIINGGSVNEYIAQNKILFDYINSKNILTLNYANAFKNFSLYLNNLLQIRLNLIQTNNKGLIKSNVLDKGFCDYINNNIYSDRHIYSYCINNFKNVLNKEIIPFSENEMGIDGYIYKSNYVVAYSPEFTSKPNNINKIYSYIINKILKEKYVY